MLGLGIYTSVGYKELNKNRIRCNDKIAVKKDDEVRSDGSQSQRCRSSSRLVNWVWVALGTLFVVLGTIGIFLPLLPTTPFLLLAVTCYTRGSKRLYGWLLSNRWFGNYIRSYREKKAIPFKIKVLSIAFLWATIGYSSLFAVDIPLVKVILILIAICVTIHIVRIRTLKQ